MTLRKPIFKPYFVWGEPLMMASLLSPAVAPFPHYSKPSIDFFKTPSTSLPCKRNSIKCDSFLDNISQSLLNDSLHLDRFTAFQQLQSAAGELPEVQKWEILFFSGLAWIYLTARPGVFIGAIDAYIFATLQLGLDSLPGRRNLKRSDFLVGDRLGEGSFGVVYSGLIVPNNVNVDQSVTKRASAKAVQPRQGLKDKVILKKVKIGVQGAVECGDYEEWFNYRMSRAAPDTCAEFLGSLVSDTTDTLYTKGEKWLVWKFEALDS